MVAPWVWPVAIVLVLAGVGISAYLTVAHYDRGVTLSCPNTGLVNCVKVTSSPQSYVFGVPVAVLGLAYFVAMVPLNLPRAWRSAWPPLRWGRVLMAVGGMGMVVYLVYTELFTLDAICLWCTAVHAVTFALFVVTVLATALPPLED